MNLKRKRCLILTRYAIKTVKINRIMNDCEGVKTFVFNMKKGNSKNYELPKPGQFVMIWVPGVDEIPMSISACDEMGVWSIAVKKVGECTKALHELKVGDYIGVRGPLGNYFELPQEKTKHIFLVGGGIGMAPLKFLAEVLKKQGYKFKIIEGAKIDNELIFIDEIFNITREDSELFYCTDDGSTGEKGLVTELFTKTIKDFKKEDFNDTVVYTCGPEIMMYELFQICQERGIEMHASLERIMRCGCGLCGLCAIDPIGKLVCKDGPIFKSEQLREMEDFGKSKRDFAGKKVAL